MALPAPKTTFIYALCEPGTKAIRYFGKANSPCSRRDKHVKNAKAGETGHKANWIRGLLTLGQAPDVHVLCEVPCDDWERFERAFISLGREYGLKLTNATPGGEGPMVGRTGDKHPMFGKKLSLETRQKISASNRGLERTPETRAKMSKAFTGRKIAPEKLAREAAARRAKLLPPEDCVELFGHFNKPEDVIFARNLGIAILYGRT